MTYYDILDISPLATSEEVRQAYRELVEIHHPDRMQTLRGEVQERAGSRLKQINEAYHILRDPERRARYDAQMHQGGERGAPAPVAGEATSSLEARLAEIEQQIVQLAQQIQWARPRGETVERMNQWWDRYLFASISLLLPFLFLGIWASRTWAAHPRAASGVAALVLLGGAGYLVLAACMGAGHVRLSETKPVRTILSVPLLLALLGGAVALGAPRTFHLLLLLAGYVLIVWQGVGQVIAARRDEVEIAASKTARLSQELYECQVEREQLNRVLAQRQ